jgi:hypothetical protein
VDFNFLRFRHEKSKGRFDNHWLLLFNAIIDSLDLREVEMIGQQFTWMDADWETKSPMVSIRALERTEGFFDHAPILMTTGGPSRQTTHRFKFELGWLERTSFDDMVKGVWERLTRAGCPIQRWNNKLCYLRSHLSGWAQHESGVLKKEKQRLTVIINNM